MPYGIISTQDQLAAQRDAAESGVALVHVDTCLSSYVQDHHNRDGECLFGVYVDGGTDAAEVLSGLLAELRATGDRIPDYVTDDDAKGAIKAWFAEAFGTSPEALAKPFDSRLEMPSEDELENGLDESCQAWFVLTWQVLDAEGGGAD